MSQGSPGRSRNPSGSRWNVAWGELIDAGKMVGARIYATGAPLTTNNAPDLEPLDRLAARASQRRDRGFRAEWGRIHEVGGVVGHDANLAPPRLTQPVEDRQTLLLEPLAIV